MNNGKDHKPLPMKAETPRAGRVSYKPLILIVLIMAGIGTVFMLQSQDSTSLQSGESWPGKGGPAPDFTLPGLDGNEISLADYRGKVVLLNLWATWCRPCVEEMPAMEKLHRALKDESFAILAVSLDEAGAEVVGPFMQKHQLSFTALTDTKGSLKKLYRTTGVPETFIIDKKGIIVEKIIGPRDWAAPGAIRYFRNLIQAD